MLLKEIGILVVLLVLTNGKEEAEGSGESLTSVPPQPIEDESNKTSITRNRFKVRRTNLPLKMRDEGIKNPEDGFKSKSEAVRKDLLVKHRHPVSTPSIDVKKNETEETFKLSDDVVRKKIVQQRIEEPSDEVKIRKGSIVNVGEEIVIPSSDVIQDRIDIVESDEHVETAQNLVRLRVVEMEMFKCHRGCIVQKSKQNLKVENISEQLCDLGELEDMETDNLSLRFYNSCICSCKIAINQKRQLCLQGKGVNCPKAHLPFGENSTQRSRVRTNRKNRITTHN